MSKNILSIIVFLLLIQGCSPIRQATHKTSNKVDTDSIDFARQRQNAILFSEGLREKFVGQSDKAIARFEAALQAYPTDHASMFELSELYFRKGRTNEALQMARQATQLNPANEWYLLRLAQLSKLTTQYEEMLNAWQRLVELNPQKQEYYSELANAYIAMNRVPDALATLDQLEKIAGLNEELSLQKLNLHLLNNDARSAIMEIEKLAAAYPFESRYQAMLADLYLKNGDSVHALEQYEKMRQLSPDDPNVLMSLAEFYKEQGDEDKAFDMLINAFASASLDVETKVQVMMLWFQGASFSEELNQKAERIANTLLATHPESPRGHQLLGDVYLRRSEWEKAREQFEIAVEMEPGNYAAWETLLYIDIQLSDYESLGGHTSLALTYFPEQPLVYLFDGYAKYQKGNYDAALKTFEAGRKLVVNNDRLLAEFFSSMGDVQHKLKNHEASDAAYEKALAINPANATVLNNYAYYLSLRGENLQKAKEMSAKALELQPDNSSFLDTHAWVLFKSEDYEQALEYILKALKASDKPNATLIEHYGDILWKLGRREAAVKQWKEALKVGEGSEFLQRKARDGKMYE